MSVLGTPPARILSRWFAAAVVITLLAGVVYAASQQVLRQTANDPQIQLAEDAGAALAAGQPAAAVVPATRVDIATSLAPFVVVYDAGGKAMVGTGRLHDQLPALPAGVFDYARQHGEDRITWQPEPGVRAASVVVAFGGSQPGFVLAGRSLREVEVREDNVRNLVAVGWLVTVLAAGLAVAAVEWRGRQLAPGHA